MVLRVQAGVPGWSPYLQLGGCLLQGFLRFEGSALVRLLPTTTAEKQEHNPGHVFMQAFSVQ